MEKKNDGGKDLGSWAIPWVAVVGAAYAIFRHLGWVSEKTTRDQFMFEIFKFVVIAGVIGFAVWGIVELIRKALAAPQEPLTPPPSPSPPSPPPFIPTQQPTASAADQWWLQLNGQATGPFATEAVFEAVLQGDFVTTTLACPVGGSAWKAISDWPPFAATTPSRPTPSAR